MLITCPECSKQISDKAVSCPNCGYPLNYPLVQQNAGVGRISQPKRAKKSNGKLPNGFGHIKYIGEGRIMHYIAYPPTTEYRDDGSAVMPKQIGSFRTYQEAYKALVQYHENPYATENADMTFADAYNIYKTTQDYLKLSEKSMWAKDNGFEKCKKLHNTELRKLNKAICQAVLDENHTLGTSTLRNMLSVIRIAAKAGMDRNLIMKDFSSGLKIEVKEVQIVRTVFTKEEIEKLRGMEVTQAKILLMLMFTGLRINELLKNYQRNIDLDEMTIYVPKEIAKNKPSERTIPIPTAVQPLFRWYKENNINMCFASVNVWVKANFPGHHCHDARHTFATWCTQAGISEVYTQRLMGHEPSSILYSIYTHITIDQLREEIEKIGPSE